ncbi:MAG: DUF11 domain-containing protein, partial [Sphingobacteriaceae bacterium]
MIKFLRTLTQSIYKKWFVIQIISMFFNPRTYYLLIFLFVSVIVANAQDRSIASYSITGKNVNSQLKNQLDTNTKFSVNETNLNFSWSGMSSFGLHCTRKDKNGNYHSDNFEVYNSGNRTNQNTPNIDIVKNYIDDDDNGSGSFNLGPNKYFDIWFRYFSGNPDIDGCEFEYAFIGVSGKTDQIHAPYDFTATFNAKPFAIQLDWHKGTTIDDDKTGYLIKRGGVEIARISGDKRSYQDLDVAPGKTYTYTVQTIVGGNAPADWVKDVSSAVSVTATALSDFALVASADQLNKVKLSWPSLSDIDGTDALVIIRNGVELVSDLSKFSKTYTDQDVVPGLQYNYQIKMINKAHSEVENWISNTAFGKSTPNGKLSGYIRSSTGVGIAGIVVSARSTAFLYDGATTNWPTYTATTDADGYYEIAEIFYNRNAEFVLTPKMPGYDKPRFTPATLNRKLTLDEYNVKNVNFTDTASFTVKGKVYFVIQDKYNQKKTLGTDSVDIYVDGIKKAVTNSDGDYNLSFPVAGNYHIAASFKEHNIKPTTNTYNTSNYSYTQTTTPITKTSIDKKPLYGIQLAVNTNYTNVNFIDAQTDILTINAYATDGHFALGEEISVNLQPLNGSGANPDNIELPVLTVFSNGNRVSQSGITINSNNTYLWNGQQIAYGKGDGTVSVVLPACRYKIGISQVFNKQNINSTYGPTNVLENTNKYLFFQGLERNVSLFNRDTTIKVDSVITRCSPEKDIVKTIKGKNGQDSVDITKACSVILEKKAVYTKIANIRVANFVYHQDLEIVWQEENDNDWKANDLLAVNGRLSTAIQKQWNTNTRKSGSLYLMSKQDRNQMTFQVVEKYRLYENEVYQLKPVDSAYVEVFDQIGDKLNKQRFKYIPRNNAAKTYQPFSYLLIPGDPNFSVEPFHEKSMQIFAIVGDGPKPLTTSKILYGMVQGERQEEGKGVVISPNVPYMVLHRPPGDESYTKILKGSTFTWKETKKYGGGGSAGIKVEGGIGTSVFGVNIFGELETSAVFGRDNNGEQGFQKTLTVQEEIATASSEENTGKGGDIIFFNTNAFSYGVYTNLVYEKNTSTKDGKINVFKTASLADQGVQSSVMYTYNHVKNTEIPKLQNIINDNNTQLGIEQNKATKDISKITSIGVQNEQFGAQIKVYNKVLHNIDSVQTLTQTNKDKLRPLYQEMVQSVLSKNLSDADANNAVKNNLDNDNGNLYAFQKNITFSNGVDYTFRIQNAMSVIDNFEYEVYFDMDLSAIAGFSAGELNYAKVGAVATVHAIIDSKVIEREGVKENELEVHLSDNDSGDHFSVDVLVDPLYKTPLFGIYGGSSSCPWEEGTLQRSKPKIGIVGAQKQINVPADKPASFTVQLGNESVTNEAREYKVVINPRSNPNGAKIFLGGQQINNGEAIFYIQPKDSARITLEVWRGPLSYQYDDIELVMTSTCDNTLIDNLEDQDPTISTVKVSVSYTPACGIVDLFKPGKNWLVSSLNNNRLQTTFSNYDANNPNLKELRLEYRRKTGVNAGTANESWKDVTGVKPADLKDAFYDYSMNVENLLDGEYELRAKSICTDGYYYSDVYAGRIDRASVNVYGLPEPQNGILGIGTGISVAFNAKLAAAQPLLQLKVSRADNGQDIPVTYTMNADRSQISITPVGGFDVFDKLENITLNAIVAGVVADNANKLQDSIKWSFVVNRSPVYWDPTSVSINSVENQGSSFGGRLKNKTATEQSFTLVQFPSWLKPTITNGKVVPFGETNIDFAVNANLNTGHYADTVVALIANRRQYLYVSVDVLRTPPVWTVNPAKYRYNMNITAQFSRDETDTLTSKDIRDKIAVFAGNECRGFASIQYDSNLKKYVAFITAYSNTSGTEKLAFRLWDAYPGVEYESNERLDFISNGIVGSTANPFIAHAGGVYQSIILKKGWNWISLNVKNTDMSVRTALASLKSTPGDEIKTLTSNAYSQYADKLGWVGKLDSISLYSGYMINVAHDDTLRVLGQMQRSPVRIQLGKGWSWIGYPMPINISLTDYFKNFTPADKDIVVSQEEFAQYNAATKSWSGSLQFLRPGKAYKIYSNNGISVPAFTNASQDNDAAYISALINQPANTQVIYNNPQGAISSTIDPFLKVNSTDFKNNMTITAIISQDGGRVNDISRYEIRLSINNQLVSISGLTRLPNDQAVAFIPVYGNDNQEGQKVDVVIYDKQNQKQYPITISAIKGTLPTLQNQNGSGLGVLGPVTPSKDIYQQQDAILGTVEVPKIFALNGQADVSVTTALNKQQISLGDTVQYTIRVKNSGPDAALNVVLADTLNTSFDYLSSNTNSLFYNNTTRALSLNYTKLLSGEQYDIVVSLRANKVGQFNIGQSSVTLDNDPVSINNRAPAIAVEVTDRRANEAKIFIPGLFTPNGDGINDRFVIVGLNDYYPSNTLIIYNKNYNEVYHKVNYQNDWSGNNLPMGSYAYFLKVTT